MEWTYESVEHAREAVSRLLEQLGLDAYLFGVEPRGENWEIRLEYATTSGWATRVITVDSAALVESYSDSAARSALLHTWNRALRDAKRAARQRAPV